MATERDIRESLDGVPVPGTMHSVVKMNLLREETNSPAIKAGL